MRISDWSSDVCSSDLGWLGRGRALLCLANTGVHWPAAALQFQQLFAKGLDFQPLLLERALQLEQLRFQIIGKWLSEQRWCRQSKQSNDGDPAKGSFSTSLKHQPSAPEDRSEGRPVGEERVSTGRYWCSP